MFTGGRIFTWEGMSTTERGPPDSQTNVAIMFHRKIQKPSETGCSALSIFPFFIVLFCAVIAYVKSSVQCIMYATLWMSQLGSYQILYTLDYIS